MGKVTSTVLNVGIVIGFVIVLAVVGPALEGAPSDAEAAQDIAADKVQAPIDAAMVAFGSNVMEVMP